MAIPIAEGIIAGLYQDKFTLAESLLAELRTTMDAELRKALAMEERWKEVDAELPNSLAPVAENFQAELNRQLAPLLNYYRSQTPAEKQCQVVAADLDRRFTPAPKPYQEVMPRNPDPTTREELLERVAALETRLAAASQTPVVAVIPKTKRKGGRPQNPNLARAAALAIEHIKSGKRPVDASRLAHLELAEEGIYVHEPDIARKVRAILNNP